MENEVRKKLVVELYQRIQFAKQVQSGFKRSSVEDDLFLKLGGFSTPTNLTRSKYFQIVQFYLFLKENPNLADEEIREILNSNNKFSFIRKLDSKTPDLFNELKLYGPMVIATDYASRKQTNKELTKRLP